MVIIMDMTTGKVELAPEVPAYDDEVMMAGFAELPAELPREHVPQARLAEVAAESRTVDEREFMHRMYVAQGLPGRLPRP